MCAAPAARQHAQHVEVKPDSLHRDERGRLLCGVMSRFSVARLGQSQHVSLRGASAVDHKEALEKKPSGHPCSTDECVSVADEDNPLGASPDGFPTFGSSPIVLLMLKLSANEVGDGVGLVVTILAGLAIAVMNAAGSE